MTSIRTLAGLGGFGVLAWALWAQPMTAQAQTAAPQGQARAAASPPARAATLRALPSRANRHALIIGIGKYADANTPELPGVKFDRDSATQIAQSMQVPAQNIRYLQNEQATGDGIRQALRELNDRVLEGDRVFIHYSGHGTRYLDPQAGGCVEALLAYDGGAKGQLSNHEIAGLLSPITRKADKLFVMYDACHSGGVAQAQSVFRTRNLSQAPDESGLRGKFTSTNEECGRPVNVKTRNLIIEASSTGVLPQDIIHLSASRDNEISFDDEAKGGLATQYMRDCLLHDAKDADGSGALSMEELRQCAQEKINKRMSSSAFFKPHNLVLNGNADFVPAWFSREALATVDVASPVLVSAPATMAAANPAPAVAATAASASASASAATPALVAPLAPAPAPAVAPVAAATPAAPPPPPPPLTGKQALQQMLAQGNAKHTVKATLGQSRLKIGRDALDLSLQSSKAGYVYLALAGSDNQSVYLLFPNDLDQNNKIEAGQTLKLPRPHWRVKAAGPAGTDSLLVLVADAPRDIRALAAAKAGPFMVSLNDQNGRAQLGALLTSAKDSASARCGTAARAGAPCSDAYGATLLSVEETP